ncbi:MAG: FKBP-type peptidyl-prolyl cis-trans isomerase [Solirubrobacterales bacterium]
MKLSSASSPCDPIASRSTRTGRVSRSVPALAALATAALLAGCGSSGNSSTIAPGQENPNAAAEIAKSSTSSTATTGTTPTSGPLATEPKVTPPTGAAPTKLVTKDLIVGTGPEAKAGDSVTVNYVGVLYKGGKIFDASWNRHEPFTFTLGEGKVIPGWDQGVAGKKVGGRRELIIPGPLAYGAQGSPPTIPPNATLVFVVDLLST